MRAFAGTRFPCLPGSPLIVWLMLFVVPSSAGQAEWKDWTTMLSAEYFPTHLSAIYFPRAKLTIDANRTLKWGSWTVSFGRRAPLADYYQGTGIRKIMIGLRCANPAAGEHDCTMFLIRVSAGSDRFSQCEVAVNATIYHNFHINCPSHLLVEQ